MTDDLLERQLSDAMERRAQGARPRPATFADVERRAARQRRVRTGRALVVMVSALTVVAILGVVGVTRRDEVRSEVTTASDPTPTAPVVPVDGVDRWPALAGSEPVREEVAVTTSGGLQPDDGGQRIEVTPYLVVGTPRVDHMVMYGLDGGPWRTTTSWLEPDGPDSFGTMRVLTGTSFDPTRLDQVPNSTGVAMRELDEGPPPDPETDPWLNDRPETLLASPERRHLVLPVERIGSFDWTILPESCIEASGSCELVAVGGDGARLVVVELQVPAGFDLRDLLARVELRTADELALAPGESPAAPPGAVVMPNQAPAPYAAAPFLLVRLPLGQDDSAWPTEVPADYCEGYSQWKRIQMDHLGAFGTPGWIRWVQALDAIAPPEVGDAWSVLATEQAAGRDTSATEPGVSALDTVVVDGDARCPA